MQTARLYIAPPPLAVAVTPGHVRIARGTPLRITARIDGLPEGATPDVPTLHVSPPPTRCRSRCGATAPATSSTGRASRPTSATASSPARSRRASTRWRRIDAARVKRIDLDYAFPAFTKLAPRHDEDGGDIFGPAGTTVQIRVHTDKPVRRGAVALEGGTALPLAAGHDATELAAGLDASPRTAPTASALEDIDGLRARTGRSTSSA